MEILQLQYFCAVAEVNSIAEVARYYRVTASGITQSIKRLEEEIGGKLFDRGANSITLNSAGSRFYRKVAPALKLLKDATDAASKSEELPIAEVEGTVSLCLRTNRRLVTEAIKSFKAICPKVNFMISHTLSPSALREYDIIVSDKIPFEESYQKTLLTEERMLLAMTAEHPLAEKSEITPETLEGEKFISMNKDSSLYSFTNALFAELSIAPDIIIRCDDPYYVRQYVSMGFGIAIVPECSWKGQFDENILLRTFYDCRRQTYMFLPSDTPLPQEVRLFADCLTDTFKQSNILRQG